MGYCEINQWLENVVFNKIMYLALNQTKYNKCSKIKVFSTGVYLGIEG